MSEAVSYNEERNLEQGPADGRATVPPADPVRRVYRALTILAPVAVVIAIAVNWAYVPDARQPLPSPAGVGARPGVPGASGFAKLEKPSIKMLPERVIGYEALTHQAIPGYGNTAAETVYKTLSMNIEAQIAIVVYARVEGFSSQGEAQARLDELMKPYTANVSQQELNGTVAKVADAADRSAHVVGWVRGPYATMVKTSYQDYVPADTKADKLIKFQSGQIVDAVDVYQRTGREGISK